MRQLNLLDNNLALSLAQDAFLSEDCPSKEGFAGALSSFMIEEQREEFFTSLVLNDSDSERRACAVEILAGMVSTDRVAAVLLEVAMNDQYSLVRQNAVRALAKNSSAQVQRALIEIAASDGDPDVRYAAICSLDLSFPETVPALMEIAANPHGCYYTAMRRLYETGSPEAGEFLLSVVQNKTENYGDCWWYHYYAPQTAAEYLGNMGGEYRVAAFKEVLCGENFDRWFRRSWAANAANYSEPEIEPILRYTALNDPDKGVREIAAISLQKIYKKYEEELAKSRLANAPESPQQ